MSDKQKVHVSLSERALEMVMRDVLDTMSELSLESGFKPSDGGFEIIDIYPAHRDIEQPGTPKDEVEAEVLQFPDLRRAVG